jgi:hypothetical protein
MAAPLRYSPQPDVAPAAPTQTLCAIPVSFVHVTLSPGWIETSAGLQPVLLTAMML